MHLCRHTVYSPIPLVGYLREALEDVQMDAVMYRFGAFFLHELDIKECRLSVLRQKKDGPEILYHMDADRKDRQRRRQRLHIPNTYANETYPLGENPPWNDIVRSIKGNPTVLMKPFATTQFWSPDEPAYRIFVAFTGDMIDSVNLEMWKGQSRPSRPKDIQQALQFWSAVNLAELLPNSLFLAQNASIPGPTRQQRHFTFREMMAVFFPDHNKPLHPKSIWQLYAQKGYLKELHDTQRMLLRIDEDGEGADRVQSLQHSLGDMLLTAQCLPVTVPGSAHTLGAVWKGKGGRIHLWTNSRYYRVKSIGTGPITKRAKIPQPRASMANIGERLSEVHRGVPINVTKKKKYALSRMSQKRKAYRPPPQRKTAAQHPDEEVAAKCQTQASEHDNNASDSCLVEEQRLCPARTKKTVTWTADTTKNNGENGDSRAQNSDTK
jgi:hypothetical protein